MRNAIISLSLVILSGLSQAASADPAVADKSSPEQIQAWRKEGPAAVDRLMDERKKLIAAAKATPGPDFPKFGDREEQAPAQRAAWEKVYAINETIDAVAGARYSHESGLYWSTDEAEAFRQAKEQEKPVLALRLLGNLDEELSCANSRYFRILLYPDDKVRQLLHDKFILTWKSVREVPKITIDLGKGRMIERTITGNSVHYVVLPNGKVVDLFPGLYGPVPFHERLAKAHTTVQRAIDSKQAAAVLADYRQQRIVELEKAWREDVVKYEEWQRKQPLSVISAEKIGQAPYPPPSFWEVAGKFHPEYAELGEASRGFLKHEAVKAHWERISPDGPEIATQHGVRVASIPTFMKGGDEAVLGWLLNCVEPALQADTLQNEYRGRYFALKNFLDDSFEIDLEELNSQVYQHIFQYDPYDPWIGLAHVRSLTALPKDRGLKRPERKE